MSPISWTHHWLWVLPALATLAGPRRPRGGRLAPLGGFTLLVLSPLWWLPNEDDREYRWHGWQLVIGNSYVIAAVLFLLVIGVHVFRPHAPAGRHGDQTAAGRGVGRTERTALTHPAPRVPSSTTTLS
ncbi:hypothetical protein [Protofrankia coriariae]|uniref:Uncharacterized protein n=1 Tax=Protofrankia coriariae TaxID=1562887 RepID=A0ABR5F6M4_9ACTN|nr:hypothetical protein [Protofrankia coriariae]KLL12305.1 hypothetical protein FrCorBMG51_06440 [Protofrankia coriariae]